MMSLARTFLALSAAVAVHAQTLSLATTTPGTAATIYPATAYPQTTTTLYPQTVASVPASTVTPAITTTATPQVAATVSPGGTATTAVPAAAAAAAAAASATAAPWSGCTFPGDLIQIGNKTTICIVLGSNTEWNTIDPTTKYLRLSFQPLADQYSRFHVPSSYQDLVVAKAIDVHDGTNNVTIHVASQTVLSFQRIFYAPNAGAGKIYPFLTAIIDVQKGVVRGITWDDACLFCGDDKCEENTYDFNGNMGNQQEFGQPTKACYIPQAECTASMAVAATNDDAKPVCDITVYVVWTGDDADGRALQSSNFRFSAFPEQEIQNRILDSLPDVPDLGLGDVFGVGTTPPQ